MSGSAAQNLGASRNSTGLARPRRRCPSPSPSSSANSPPTASTSPAVAEKGQLGATGCTQPMLRKRLPIHGLGTTYGTPIPSPDRVIRATTPKSLMSQFFLADFMEAEVDGSVAITPGSPSVLCPAKSSRSVRHGPRPPRPDAPTTPTSPTPNGRSSNPSFLPLPEVVGPAPPTSARSSTPSSYLFRSGCARVLLSHEFPHPGTVYDYFSKWRRDGTIERIHDALRRTVREASESDPEPSVASLRVASVTSWWTSWVC